MCDTQGICGYWRHLLFKAEDKALSKENKNKIVVKTESDSGGCHKNKTRETGVARHASNLKAQEDEAGGSL